MGPITDQIKKHIPNYEELFGRADMCECQHCRSVYSPASYLVDIMRFLDRSTKNQSGSSPLTVLLKRRPDLEFLPLTCENTNTIIPYIDLVNEVMEYYVANNNSLDKHAAHDTGDTTAAELRANPQHTMIAAYEIIKDAVFPFTLPYHQPLDVIRTYLAHLKTSRAELMEIFRTDDSESTTIAIAAEYLKLSEEEYQTLTGTNFSDIDAAKDLWKYFGYDEESDSKAIVTITEVVNNQNVTINCESRVTVPELLSRTGIKYVDLVELIKTKFINPHQDLLDYLESVFAESAISFSPGTNFYTILKGISQDAPLPAGWEDLLESKQILPEKFIVWVKTHFIHLQDVITLFEPTSGCDLSKTILRSIKKVYEPSANESAIIDTTLIKLHTFIRFWKKTGWSINELDVIIRALGETAITPSLIKKSVWVKKIAALLKIPVTQLATLWGTIDTYGKKSLYAKLFLNKAVQNIDASFIPDAFGQYLVNDEESEELITAHKQAILAAFRMSDEQFNEIVADSGLSMDTAVLNLENLSIIYRYVVLAKALKLSTTDLCIIKKLFDQHPFSAWDNIQSEFTDINPEHTHNFIELVQKIRDSGFKAPQLNYILSGADVYNNLSLPEEKVHQVIKAIRDGFSMIELDHPVMAPEAITEELIRSKMTLIFSAEITEQFIAMLNGKILYSTVTALNLEIAEMIPEELKSKITYQEGSGRLKCLGVMTDSERDTLLGLSDDISFQDGVNRIYLKPEQFIIDNLFGVFNGDGANNIINTTEAIARFLDHPANLVRLTPEEKLHEFYKYFLPFLKKRIRNNVLVQNVATIIGMDASSVAVLLQTQAEDVIKSLSNAGLSAEYFTDVNFTQSGFRLTDEKIDFLWKSNPNPESHPVPLIPANNFSVRWEGFVCAPATTEYTFIAEVQGADETVTLWLDGQQMFTKIAGDTSLSQEIVFPMIAGKMYSVKLEYSETVQDAGVRFYWKTAELPREIVPAAYLYPAAAVVDFKSKLIKWQQAAMFINGFALNTTEIEHFTKHKADFSDLDFVAVTALHWQRVYGYTFLRKQFASAAPLIRLFSEANKHPVPDMPTIFIPLASSITGWNLDYLYQLHAHSNLTVDDFKNEITLLQLHRALALAKKTGASIELLAQWSNNSTGFNTLNDIAQSIKNTVKAKYEEEDWLEVAKILSDKIRENQKEALISYLLVQDPLVKWGAIDADSLFEYFLIDVQMGAAMDTSRIKQAISAVQLFISRCLLNLENELDDNQQQVGVTPDVIDEQWMNWMKLYRVWEVNRKIAVYPENWLEPEYRDDKSPFFKELESELLQNDITDRSVENAFRNYLDKLDKVAHLEVCGIYEEGVTYGRSLQQQPKNVRVIKQEEEKHVLHVFARTQTTTKSYYYRRRDQFKHWTAWEKVDLDIRGSDDEINSGKDSGVHLIPVVWNNRLFLFCPEFMQKHKEKNIEGQRVMDIKAGTIATNALKPDPYWEIRLAWSEYKDKKWTSKEVSKEAINANASVVHINDISVNVGNYRRPHQYSFKATINNNKQLIIRVNRKLPLFSSLGGFPLEIGKFIFNSIQSGNQTLNNTSIKLENTLPYRTFFMSQRKIGKLSLKSNEYLQTEIDHSLLFSHQITDFEEALKYPFFYQETRRGYFVEPIPPGKEKVINAIKEPGKAQVEILEEAINEYVSLLDIHGNPELENQGLLQETMI